MRTINIHQVDAFTSHIFGGNPAGVVTDADQLTDDEMRKIAREMDLSETAFVLQPSSDKADLKLRFFTPSGDEVRFCGHATIGALFQLARLHLFGLGKAGANAVHVETDAGILDISVTNLDVTRITFSAPDVDLQPYRLQGQDFTEAFGVPAGLINDQATIHLDKNLNYVYIPARSLDALGKQNFDFARIRKNFGKEGIVVFCLYTNETADATRLTVRGLAPNIGIDEDPFTGSIQAGLVLSAKANKYINSDQSVIHTAQGQFIDRPGEALINHNVASGEITITASAVSVFSAKVTL